jgi:ribosomal protein S18 acetylase RimI-like enzyme
MLPGMRIARFPGDSAAVAAWPGDPGDVPAAGDLLAWDGADIVGILHPWRAPDGKLRVYFGRTRSDAYRPLADAVDGVCYAIVDEPAGVEPLTGAGFRVSRRESRYEIPVAPIDAAVPAGLRIVSADQVAVEPLARLDADLRADVPGTAGWTVDVDFFRAQTYDSPYYDPSTYRVALDRNAPVGLARVWRGPQPAPRLGLVAVLPAYRRRGLARALLAAAFGPLVERGERVVTAEVDTTNIASNALLTSLGGRVTGESVELFRDR